MNIQPNLPHTNDSRIIEQPYQLSVNRVFEVLSVRDKATLSDYSDTMDHKKILLDMHVNNADKPYALNRTLTSQSGEYFTILKGAALCVDTDLKLFWHLLNRKKTTDRISIQDLCEELGYQQKTKKGSHKTIVESFYRLSNNLINIASTNYSANFQLIKYKKEGDIIQYTFDEEFLKLMNSKNGLERHSIKVIKELKLGVSKLLYTMLTSNKFNAEGVRRFDCDELITLLGLKNKKKSKNKENIKASLGELVSNNIISDFSIKLNNIVIYSNKYVNKEALIPTLIDKTEKEVNNDENVFDIYDEDSIVDNTSR